MSETTALCQFCDTEGFEKLFSTYSFDTKDKQFSLVRCAQCGLVHTEPFLSPSELGSYYVQDYYGGSTEKFAKPVELLVRRTNATRAKKLLSWLPGHKPAVTKILDVGCGRANFLRYLAGLGYDAYGVEQEGFIFPKFTEKITFWNGLVESLPIGDQSFDAVSIWHVLEHVRDPKSVIGTIGRILKPGGILVIAVPNYGSLQAKLFGKHWFHLDLPRHLFHFNENTLNEMLARAGLKIVSRSTQSWDQNIYGFIQSALNALFQEREPNALYSVLKNSGKALPPAERILNLLGYGFLGALLFPFAVLENLFSVSTGKGASLILYARKD